MKVGIPSEIFPNELRVAATPKLLSDYKSKVLKSIFNKMLEQKLIFLTKNLKRLVLKL